MQRLIKHAAELDSSIDANSMSFANIVKAINVVQTEMGITGTTALEAGRTISGSVGAMKSAWTNLVTGFADGSADIGGLIDNLVTTIVGDGTENNLGVVGNVLPAIERALGGIVQLIAGATPKIIEIFPGLVEQVVPPLITAATDMVNAVIAVVPDLLNTVVDAIVKNAPALITAALSLIQSLIKGIQDNYQILVDGAIKIVTQLATGIIKMLPQIVQLGLDLIVSLANGISQNLGTLIPTIVDVVLKIVNTLTSPEQLKNLLDAAVQLVFALSDGLMDAIPQLVDAAIQLILNLVDFLLDPENIVKMHQAAFKLISSLVVGIINAIPKLVEGVVELIATIVENFKETNWGQIGKNIVDGLLSGLKKAWSSLKKWFKDAWDNLVGGVKDLLGIHSPSRVFAGIGKNMALGVGEGWEDEFGDIQGDIDKSLSFDDASIGITSSIRKVGIGAAGGVFGGTSIGNITINIDGAKYSDEQSLASAIALEIQNMTDRRAAVYA